MRLFLNANFRPLHLGQMSLPLSEQPYGVAPMAHALGATKSGCVKLDITHSEKKIIHKIGQIREFLGFRCIIRFIFLKYKAYNLSPLLRDSGGPAFYSDLNPQHMTKGQKPGDLQPPGLPNFLNGTFS